MVLEFLLAKKLFVFFSYKKSVKLKKTKKLKQIITKSENDEERLERGKKIFNFLLSNHSNKDTVFIFSHGGIMRQIIAAILETKKLWNLSPKNTSLFEFSFDKENWDEKSNIFNPLKWQILKFNDTPHLSD